MTSHQEITRIVEQAKQQRAEFIGSGLRSYGLPIALVAALSLVLVQFTDAPRPPKAEEASVVEVVQPAG